MIARSHFPADPAVGHNGCELFPAEFAGCIGRLGIIVLRRAARLGLGLRPREA